MKEPKAFTDTLVQLRYGELHNEMTEAVKELVTKVSSTQKAGKLVLTLNFKPGRSGQIEITDDMKLTLPKEERGSTLMFSTPEGNLQREDPRQKSFEGVRTVMQELQERSRP